MPKPKLPPKQFQWTPELAYAVGLLVTDGNLSNDGRHLIMHSADKELLETFRGCLALKNKIAKTHNDGITKKSYYRLQFGNTQLYRWLVSIGVTPAKTYTIGSIDTPDVYFRDFLRGHLDGDGTIFTYQDNYNLYKGKRYLNTRVYTKFILASERHIKWLSEKIQQLSPLKGALLYRPPQSDNRVGIWEIKFAKYESLKLFRWIYYKKNLPALERKRMIAEQLLGRVTNNKLIRLV